MVLTLDMLGFIGFEVGAIDDAFDMSWACMTCEDIP